MFGYKYKYMFVKYAQRWLSVNCGRAIGAVIIFYLKGYTINCGVVRPLSPNQDIIYLFLSGVVQHISESIGGFRYPAVYTAVYS